MFPYNNYTFGNSDNLIGTQNQLRVMQAALPTGPWTERSIASGAGNFTNNLYETRTTATTAPGPISPLLTNGGYFALGTTAPKMVYDSVVVVRNITPISSGAINQAILNIKVYVTGVVPINITNLALTTAGSTSAADILNARLFFTGASTSFLPVNQFGSSVSTPSGAFNVAGSQVLSSGENNFWLVYDISATAALGNILAANCTNVTVDGNVQTVTNPAAGGRQVTAPMAYVGQTTNQTVLSKVESGSFNNRILDIQVQMSPTGAPIAATSFNFNTNGSGNPSTALNAAKLYYTGSSNTFSTAVLVGTASNPNGAFTITSNVSLNNGVNHFWLTYDIKSSATVGDSVDAEFIDVTIGGALQTVTGGAPSGARYVRAPYCASTFTNPAADGEIWNVTVGSLNNTSACAVAAPGPGSVAGSYSNFTTSVAAPNLVAGLPINFSVNTSTCGGSFQGAMSIWIDLNQDGDFTDLGEEVHASPLFNYGLGVFRTGSITIPCSATRGTTTMRVTLLETGILPLSSCGTTFGFGETEDYLVNIVENSNSYISAATTQQTGTTSAGALNVPILRVTTKLNSNPCSPGTANEFRFNTAGSTSATDIITAKLYKTGASQAFSTSNLVGTVPSPSGSFSFIVSDTTVNDTNTYWLAYDVSSIASNANVLDARIDSLNVYGNWYIPSNNNPTGNVLVSIPMTYLSSTAAHTIATKVARPSRNNVILRMMVRTSSTGATIPVTSFNLSTNGGGIDTSNIDTIRVWYSGANSNFTGAASLFGTYVPTGIVTSSIGSFAVNGSQNVLNDTNYFWLTYGIKAGANVGDSIDAELTSVTVGGTPQTPTISAPAGNRLIRNEYCAAINTGAFPFSCITNVQLNTLANNTGATCPNNPTYTFFTNTTTVAKNTTYNLSVTPAQTGDRVGVWFDWNDNGIFEVSEYVQVAINQTNANAATVPVTVPCNAAVGTIRMRVRSEWQFGVAFSSASACTALTYGETEDYTITIADNPVSYVSSQALTGSSITIVGQGATDFPVLRLRVKGGGCGVGTTTEIRFNTAATTTASNITTAKLYKTTGATFNTANLLSSITSPSGQFIFTITDTLITNDTNNFWLAYDVSSGATNGNLLDAAVDSIQVLGAYYIPANSNPTGTYTIQTPMTFVASNTFAVTTVKVGQSSVNNPVIGYQVEMSATGAPVDFTSITVSTAGTPNLADITNLKVFYTGNSNTFSPITQFGSTVATPAASHVITGNLALANGINYFWITYDIPTAAILGDTVDAEVITATVAGVPQVPTSTSAAGFRTIRANYCPAPYSTGKTDGDLLSRVRIIGTPFDNNSGTAPVNPAYTYFTGQPNYTATLIQGSIYQVEVTIGSFAGQGVAAWLDYNDDGIFQPSERIGFSTGQITVGFGTATFPIALTCAATPGVKRLRVRCNYNMNGNIVDPCASYTWGECEDYDVNIGVNPGVYGYSTAVQVTGTISPGAVNAPVLRIPVTATGCTSITTNSFNFNGTGTTNMADILSAKIYKTGNSKVFSASNLIGSLSTPSSTFSITAVDTLLNGFTDTNNYWLAVDVASGATTFNTIDAQVPSIVVNNISQTPANTNPAGNLVIQPPMTYVSSNTTLPSGSPIGRGSKNNQMARIMVITSSAGAPIPVTSIEANTTALGANNIDTAEVWFTGNSPFFTPTTQFGAAIANPNGLITFTGSQNLNNDTNYFWLTYDLKATATIGDSVDADVTGLIVGATNYIPTVVAGANNRKIIAPYCETNLHSSVCNGNDIINNVSTTGGLTNISNLNSGCSPAPSGNYAYYGTQTVTAYAGGSFTINYQSGATGGGFRIYADYNQDGDFSDANEEIAYAPSAATLNTTLVSVPITALIGTTRLRVRYASFIDVTDPCLNIFQGETEDYNLNVVPLPAPTTYTWNQTTPANFNTASNWTPSRSSVLGNDKLLFNSGGSVTVTNLPNQTIGELTVANNTTVEFTGSTGIITTPVLTLTAGTFKTNNARINVGLDTITLGTITGTGTIEGNMGRYVNSTSTTVNFPLSQGINSRALDINFTTSPVTGGLIQAGFVPGVPTTAGLPLTEGVIVANKIAREGIWRVLSGVTGSTYSISANGAGMVGITDYLTTVLARRSGTFANWTLAGIHATTTGSNAAPVFNRTGLTVFGEFAMIADSNVNPLPVRWIAFDAANVDGDVKLTWSTALEINNKGFEVERSLDGVNFRRVTFVKGAGNSNIISNYSASDDQAFVKVGVSKLYYRIKQIDENGAINYTQVVAVEEGIRAEFDVVAYPVPFNGEFSLRITSTTNEPAVISVYDVQGKLVANKVANLEEGINQVSVSDLAEAGNGIYFARVAQAGSVKMIRLVKTN